MQTQPPRHNRAQGLGGLVNGYCKSAQVGGHAEAHVVYSSFGLHRANVAIKPLKKQNKEQHSIKYLYYDFGLKRQLVTVT